MPEIAEFLVALGVILLLGLATDTLGQRTFLPRVTLLLMFGILVGKEVLDLVPEGLSNRFEIIADMALLMIGFLLGGRLTTESFRADGSQMIWVSISAALVTCLVVCVALVLAGMSAQVAVLLGCIAAATAPAATLDTVMESGSHSRFSRLLVSIVAIDDAWALILFSLGLAATTLMNGGGDTFVIMFDAMYEIVGAVLLGLAIGVPAAFLTGRISQGRPMLLEALGLVFACGGLAIWLEVSFLIASMVMGAVIANLARHHDYAFHEIENIEAPFMVLFFILAGAMLEISAVQSIGVAGMIYIIARITGKVSGAWLGASVSKADDGVKRWMGAALLPQAGVAIGMALLASNRFPEYQQTILSIVISATVFFELTGPVFTRIALRKTEVMDK